VVGSAAVDLARTHSGEVDKVSRDVIDVVGVAGAGPGYSLTLGTGQGALSSTGDVVGVRLVSSTGPGAIMRVSGVAVGDIVPVIDDIKPGGGVYGTPQIADDCWITTPTTGLGFVNPPHLGLVWDEAWTKNVAITETITAGAVDERHDTFTPFSTQTAFVLSATPLDATDAKAYVDGVRAAYGTDYTIVGTAVTWLDTEYQFEGGEVFIVDYYA